MVSMATGYLATVGDAGSELNNVTGFCDSLYGPSMNSTQTDLCLFCTTEATQCLQLSGLIAIAMLTSFVGTILPCFFFCCCASAFKPPIPPEVDAEIQKMQIQRESIAAKARSKRPKRISTPPTSDWHQ